MCDDATRGCGDESESGAESKDDYFSRGPEIPRATDDATHLSLDTLFEILSKPRCRLTLAYLEEISEEAVELDDIAAHVAECEAEAESAEAESTPERHHREVALTLHHRHLPELSDAAIVDYDPRSRSVRYWGNDRVAAYLERIRSDGG